MEVVIDVAAAIGQLASAMLAVPAAVIAYFAFKTAKSASDASATLASIEKARLHAELRPQFVATATRLRIVPEDDATEPSEPFVRLDLEFVGPPPLEKLDSLDIEIRRITRNTTTTDRREPYRFTAPHSDGWTLSYASLLQGDIYTCTLAEEKTAPRFEWYPEVHLRVILTCRSGDLEPWTVPITLREMRDGSLPAPPRPSPL